MNTRDFFIIGGSALAFWYFFLRKKKSDEQQAEESGGASMGVPQPMLFRPQDPMAAYKFTQAKSVSSGLRKPVPHTDIAPKTKMENQLKKTMSFSYTPPVNTTLDTLKKLRVNKNVGISPTQP